MRFKSEFLAINVVLRCAAAARRAPASPLAALLLFAFAATAIGQQYRSDPVDKEAKRNSSVAFACARGTSNYATERQKVLDYFVKCYFPEMTRTEPVALARLGPSRVDLFRKYLLATSSDAMQRDLTEEAYKSMRRIVLSTDPSPYHPAVRYNAVLIIGMLDEQYAIDGGASSRPAKPLAKANAFLVDIVNYAAAGKAVPPPVLAGALVGLERHARFREGLPREAIEPMTTAALKIASQEKPPIEMDSKVHAWMRLKAANVLAQLGDVGTKNQVHDTIVKLIAEGRTLDDRCATAALADKIKYEGSNVDGARTADTALKLASDVAEAEDKRAIEFQDSQYAGGGGAIGYGGERGGISRGRGGYRGEEGGSYGAGMAEEPEDPYPRRHILSRLSDLRTGVKALKPVAPAEAQPKFDEIIAALNPAITALANEDTVSLKVADTVRTMAAAVRNAAGVDDAGVDSDADETAALEAAAAAAAASDEAPAESTPTADAAGGKTAPSEAPAETPREAETAQ